MFQLYFRINIGTPVLICLVGLFGHAFSALTLLMHWEWFALPLGLPPIEYFHAMGLLLMVRFVCLVKAPDRPNEGKSEVEKAGIKARKELDLLWSLHYFSILSVICLGTGWVTHALMVK